MTSERTYQFPTLGALFIRAINRFGDRAALSDEFQALTYRALGDLVARYVGVFQKAGLSRGRAISMLTNNRVDAVAVIAAAMVMGLRYTPLHPKSAAEDHAFILEDAEADALVFDEVAFEEHGRKLLSAHPRIIGFAFGGAPFARNLNDEAASVSPQALYAAAESDDIAVLIYTGGTTGKPKGVAHAHRSLVTNLLTQLAVCELPQSLRFLAVTPVSHAAFLFILPTFLRGGEFIMRAKFDPAGFVRDLSEVSVTATFLVPTMIYALLDRPEIWKDGPGALQTLLYGAAPMAPARIAEALEAFGPILVQIYGQTESPNVIAVLGKSEHDLGRTELFKSCGAPTPGIEISLRDDDFNEVAQGSIGEICVRGPLVMQEYWRREEETQEAMRDGWLRTGDLARFDPAGYLYIEDRKKDLIISGGFNVLSREVEDILHQHEGVATACVIGVPHPKWGEAVLAIVQPSRKEFRDAQALIALVREKKGAIYAPKEVEFVDALPVTALGKPDKKALRARYWVNAERAVN